MGRGSHVADVLAEVFRRGGMKRALRRAEAVLLWPQVVGRQVARFTHAAALRGGVLFVEVPDSETAMHLTLQRDRFLDVYRGRFGVREVNDIRFQVGRAPAPPEPEEPAPEHLPDPHDLARLARGLGELDLPEPLAGPAMQTARSLAAYRARRRSEGWVPCKTCGTLTDQPDRCVICERYARDPKVVTAAGSLAVDPAVPTPQLSEDERAVAVSLALARLEEDMTQLLPQVLAEPGLRTQLQAVAHCYLALLLGKSPDLVEEADRAKLPVRVARALGSW